MFTCLAASLAVAGLLIVCWPNRPGYQTRPVKDPTVICNSQNHGPLPQKITGPFQNNFPARLTPDLQD